MKYTDFQLIWRFESMIFKAKHFFHERSLHTAVHKLRGTSFTLRHAGRKKYFNDFLYHFCQKMRLAFRNMTFQTLCILWTGLNILKHYHYWIKFDIQKICTRSFTIVSFLNKEIINETKHVDRPKNNVICYFTFTTCTTNDYK